MNIHTIETIYILGAFVAIFASYPQLRQLMRAKQSDEFSLSTWVVWLVTQCITLVYVTSIGNKLMMVVSVAWITFYVAMISLIIYYHPARKRRKGRGSDQQPEFIALDE
jgi:PQ loop repeat.